MNWKRNKKEISQRFVNNLINNIKLVLTGSFCKIKSIMKCTNGNVN